ncbi:MAG TPA: rhodanese-like domain-containing protein [Pyrinomonadaceae bacterium]|nr:rhodanese-like domain-containing protein [Pyrinomonadaceae bacterium]
MCLKTIYSAMILMAMLVLASCNAVDTTVYTKNNNNSNTVVGPPTTYADGARRITTGELETLIAEGKVYLVDVRSQDSYDMGHIPGSHLIPAQEFYKHVDKLPRDKMIVTYCS